MDGKVLQGSYQLEGDNPELLPAPAMLLGSAYLVGRGLILEPYQVDSKTNEIKSRPKSIKLSLDILKQIFIIK